MMKIITILIIFISISTFASQFDELDKIPDGAHKGQMLLSASVSMGGVIGDLVASEENFLENSTYTFIESEVTKKLMVTHLMFSFGLNFEYMPWDQIGLKAKAKKGYILQRTIFGSQFENWSEVLYSDWSLLVGPSLHLTTRKRWDITLTPLVGYSIAELSPAPVGNKLISGYSSGVGVSSSGLVLGSELNFSSYFSGGFYLTAGIDWTMNFVSLSDAVSSTNPDTNTAYSTATSTSFHSISFVIAAGYAFSN